MDPELPWRAIKAVVEVAGCAYLGQALVAAFAGARRHENIVYQIFKILTNPVDKAVRFVMPRFIPDRHIPFVSFGILIWVWLFAIVMLARVIRQGAGG
ncbi:MAG TPA: hypothetical protein VEC19_06025 [Usitatibacter sp.]|nr:hypothetical protein [Usitatibacter sp.]